MRKSILIAFISLAVLSGCHTPRDGQFPLPPVEYSEPDFSTI